MTDHPIHLLTGGDERFAPGIAVAIASALATLDRPAAAVVHVLDGGLSQRTHKRLGRVTRRANATLHLHDARTQNFSGFRPGHLGSTMYYARLRMGSLIDAPRVIYFDSDMVLLGDLQTLWRAPMDHAIAMACADRKVRQLADDCPWPATEAERSQPYFNSGFLVVDLNRWRELDLENQALTLARDQADSCHWHDQTVLNYLLRGRIQWLPPTWNWQQEMLPEPCDLNALNLHFTTPKKPWLFWGAGLRFRIWRACHRMACGPCLPLFHSRERWRGFLGGVLESALRRSPTLRSTYIKRLSNRNDPDSRARRDYYESGFGGPSGDQELARKHAALSAILRRWKAR